MNSAKVILPAVVYRVVLAAVFYFATDFGWWKSFEIAFAICWVFELRDQVKELKSLLSISDAELIRVSSLTSELEEKLADLEMKHNELRAEISCL